jgi:predicted transcriptional regulator
LRLLLAGFNDTGIAKSRMLLMTDNAENDKLLSLTADVLAAYVSKNPMPMGDLPELIGSIHRSLTGLAAGGREVKAGAPVPAVPIKKSVTPDYIVSLEEGRKFKSLKRHLSSRHGMTPQQYREKWGLPASYPMVAPNYAASRSELAKKLGLGRKAGSGKAKAAPVAKPRGRKAAPAANGAGNGQAKRGRPAKA